MKKEYPPGQEIQEKIPKKEVAFAFIKPDFFADLPTIEEIIRDHGLEIIYRDQIRLSPQTVDLIYQEVKNEHFFEAMKDYLISHDVVVMLVGGEGVEAQRVLLSLKKDQGKDGVIRERLQKHPQVSGEELALWESGQHPRQNELSVVLTQKNVLHTADNAEEALAGLKAILGPKFEILQKRGNLPAELWDIFNE
ncbi:MAG: nucleoside-diphosphate kinase [Candidatus Buchananbacteria bacterium]